MEEDYELPVEEIITKLNWNQNGKETKRPEQGQLKPRYQTNRLRYVDQLSAWEKVKRRSI